MEIKVWVEDHVDVIGVMEKEDFATRIDLYTMDVQENGFTFILSIKQAKDLKEQLNRREELK